ANGSLEVRLRVVVVVSLLSPSPLSFSRLTSSSYHPLTVNSLSADPLREIRVSLLHWTQEVLKDISCLAPTSPADRSWMKQTDFQLSSSSENGRVEEKFACELLSLQICASVASSSEKSWK
ncbi:hypothetical protein ILYODFUR_036904, partial [Ilyodon furcidens]